MQLVIARPRVRDLDCCPDAPDALAGGEVRQLQASRSPVGTKFPPALERQLVPNLEEPLHHLPGSAMTDEVSLERLGFVAECEGAQAGLESRAIDGDGEHWLAHAGQAMQIGCRQGPQVLEQLLVDAGSA